MKNVHGKPKTSPFQANTGEPGRKLALVGVAKDWPPEGAPFRGYAKLTTTEIYAHLKPESLTVPDVITFDHRVPGPTVPPEGA